MIVNTEAVTVNGVSLDSYCYMLTDMSGLMSTPSKRGVNVTVPGRHGTIRVPRKRYEENDLILKMWVVGANPDGTVPEGSTELKEFVKRRDELLRLFWAETCTIAYTRPDGTTIQCTCEVEDVVDFSRQWADPMASVSVALKNPGAFWEDATTYTQTITSGAAVDLTAFAAATAPMSELTITYTGTVNNPTLTHGNQYVTWNGVISAGRQLVINTANWTVGPGTGTAWTPDVRQVSFGQPGRWLELDPTVTPFQVQLSHTGSGTVSCVLAGKRKFLAP
jgi:hypothetical protein